MLAKIWGVQKNYHFRHTAIWSLKLIGPFLNPTRAAFYSFQASICSMTKVEVFLDASSQRILFVFFNLDPSLNSHNSGSKNHSNKNHHIFRKPWTSASRWHTLNTSEKCSNLRKKRLRLHIFGPLWTISTGSQWEFSEVGRLSCFIEFFAWFHIVCGRYISD